MPSTLAQPTALSVAVLPWQQTPSGCSYLTYRNPLFLRVPFVWYKGTFRSACCVLGIGNKQKRQTNFFRPARPCSHSLLSRRFRLLRRLFNYLVVRVSSLCFGRGRWETVCFEGLLTRCATDWTTVRFWSLSDTVCPFVLRPFPR